MAAINTDLGVGAPQQNLTAGLVNTLTTQLFSGGGYGGDAITKSIGAVLPGSSTALAAKASQTPTPSSPAAASASAVPVAGSDFRARLQALNPDDVYGSSGTQAFGVGIMDILKMTNGVIFPYSPTITFTQSVQYSDLQLVHSNTDYPAYTRSPSVTINVNGKFTVQNQREGRYALAVIHFLRTVSKSYFGETDKAHGKAGLPPPILLFSAYGPYIYNKLRVILKSHSWSYDENMDTIAVDVANPAMPGNASTGSRTVRLPAMFSITTELMVVQTPRRMRKEFSFDAFANGSLLNQGGWI